MDDLLHRAISFYKDFFDNLEYVNSIKSGKEAEVHLLKNNEELLALKLYKQNTKYSSRYEYMPISRIGDARLQRAMKNRSRKGISVTQNIWSQREFNIMKEVTMYSCNIPQVFMNTETSILMEYIGTIERPAPRLIDYTLTAQDAIYAFNSIIKNINLFLELGFVHGDLSEYNILWSNNQVYIIDFPQILFINENRNAYERFSKDIDNIGKFFSKKYGIETIRDISQLRESFFQNI